MTVTPGPDAHRRADRTAPSAPAAASARSARSKTLRGLGVIAAAYERMSGVGSHRRPAPVAVDRRIVVRVGSVDTVAEDVVAVRLDAAPGVVLPGWQPGAHLDVELGPAMLRQYSLCGDPAARDHYRIAVRRIADGGGGSRAMHALRAGDELVVRGPRNAFPFIRSERYLFVAGGIGITPILPMVRDAERRGADWRFVYTGRSRASMPYLDEVEALAASRPDRVRVRPDDEYGIPDTAAIIAFAPAGAALYTCGPPAMIDSLRAAIPVENVRSLHYERFSAPPVVGGAPFEVELARSGRVVDIAADESVLTAVRRVLPDIAYSCRQGFCGTCPVAVADDSAHVALEHRDRCLTPAERASRFAICVSRATGRVTLDL